MKIWTTINKTFATAFGLGLSPLAPGTMGALGGVAIGLFILHLCPYPNYLLSLCIVLCTILGAFSAKKLEPVWGEDPSRIVIDEVVGMWIAMLFLPPMWECYIAAFVLFRFFDIVKPLYIKKMELLKNGWGVMMDDILAGIYSNAILQISILIFKKYLLM